MPCTGGLVDTTVAGAAPDLAFVWLHRGVAGAGIYPRDWSRGQWRQSLDQPWASEFPAVRVDESGGGFVCGGLCSTQAATHG